MINNANRVPALWRSLSMAAVVLGGLTLAGGAASAGECPADKAGVNVTKPNATPASGVTDTVLSSIDLGKEPARNQGHQLRLRKLVIQPGGVVPWHSHGDRPAIIYILQGEVMEYASNCAVPIVHKAGEVARETHVTAHWWKNTGTEVVVLLSADILHDANDHNM